MIPGVWSYGGGGNRKHPHTWTDTGMPHSVCGLCVCVWICLFAIFSMIMTLYSLTVHGNNNQTMPRKTDMWTIKCIKSLLKNKILVGHTFSKYHVDTYISYSYIADVSPTRKPLSLGLHVCWHLEMVIIDSRVLAA